MEKQRGHFSQEAVKHIKLKNKKTILEKLAPYLSSLAIDQGVMLPDKGYLVCLRLYGLLNLTVMEAGNPMI